LISHTWIGQGMWGWPRIPRGSPTIKAILSSPDSVASLYSNLCQVQTDISLIFCREHSGDTQLSS